MPDTVNTIAIYGQNGDHLNTPASTMSAFWSALGCGARGLQISVFLTKDHQVICAPSEQPVGFLKPLSQLTLAEAQTYDAGFHYQSIELDQEQQPTTKTGSDHPWQGLKKDKGDDDQLKARKALYYPALAEVLRTFGRSTTITIQLPTPDYALLDALTPALAETLTAFGMMNRAYLCGTPKVLQALPDNYSPMRLIADLSHIRSNNTALQDIGLKPNYALFQINVDTFIALIKQTNLPKVNWRLLLNDNQFAPTPKQLAALHKYQQQQGAIEGIVSSGPLACHNALYPKAIFFSEAFSGTKLDTSRWTGGYSHVNQETHIKVNDGLIINIAEGKEYSGGGAMPLLGFFGDFDAVVDFHVANPHQATTFELAAIAIDPGYLELDPEVLNSRKVNLTFDVHGAPPYASSERDQNDGFRCGWNNSYNLTKFGNEKSQDQDAQWQPSSSNMYNKYGRDVGDGSNQSLTGQLRLVRCGAVFNSYYRDQHNPGWVCSGSMLVSSMPETAYIRLAAKHWGKIKPAPHNCVTFTHFTVAQ